MTTTPVHTCSLTPEEAAAEARRHTTDVLRYFIALSTVTCAACVEVARVEVASRD